MIYRITPGLLCILFFASGCSSPKQSTSYGTKSTSSARPSVVNKNPKFLDNISMTPEESSTANVDEGNKTVRKTSHSKNDYPKSTAKGNNVSLQVKYARLLNTDADDIRNPVMFQFIDDWYGTKYCLGVLQKHVSIVRLSYKLFFLQCMEFQFQEQRKSNMMHRIKFQLRN